MGKNKGGPTAKDKKNMDKIVEDKTFGMKSKKSKKVQTLIKQTQQAVMGKSAKQLQQEKNNLKKEKKKKQDEQMLLGYLQNTVMKDKKKKNKEAKNENAEEEDKFDEKTASINIYVDPRDPDPLRSAKV